MPVQQRTTNHAVLQQNTFLILSIGATTDGQLWLVAIRAILLILLLPTILLIQIATNLSKVARVLLERCGQPSVLIYGSPGKDNTVTSTIIATAISNVVPVLVNGKT